MIINRIWAMPNKWTFTIKPVKELLIRHVQGHWADPFAGLNSPAQVKNDLNPIFGHDFCLDALDFLKNQPSNSFDGVLFDPPYSITQASKCYAKFGRDKLKISVSNMGYWKLVKDEMKRLIMPGGKAICFGWNSMGLGLSRGFVMREILLIPHGGSKNDTIVTVEEKK